MTQAANDIAARTIHSTRLLPFSCERVYQAWMQADLLAQWWGPDGFTNTFSAFDPRPGGDWHFVMHGPDGKDYVNHNRFIALQAPHSLTLQHISAPQFTLDVTLTPVGSGTRLDFVQICDEAKFAQASREFLLKANQENLARLYSVLETSDTRSERPFLLTREFKAPLALVYAAFTQPEHLQHWMGPEGFESIHSQIDFRVGGSHHYGIAGHGMEMWGKQIYRAIEPQQRLEYLQMFSDPQGGITRHPMAPTWPEQMLTEVFFEAMDAQHTRITLSWLPYESDETGRTTFDSARAGMVQGWAGSFAKLDGYLAHQQTA